MYVICWKATTGKTGMGTRRFSSKDEAQKVVKRMNADNAKIGLMHWIKKIDE